MKFPRLSGILLHPTSLPSPFGIGDLGRDAYQFVDFLEAAGQKIWQVLPLGPTGYGDSPYQCFSAFAGNPLLISPIKMMEHGHLPPSALEYPREGQPDSQVNFHAVIAHKDVLLRRAYQSRQVGADFDDFRHRNDFWLEDYAQFMALKRANGGRPFPEWTVHEADPEEIDAHRFWQFEFFRQWDDLKRYCEERRIRVMGDMPIYVAHDSADVWAHPELFHLDEHGNATVVAGVPPDYFTADGQLWGNPIYRWDRFEATGYSWWIERFKAAFLMVDMLRLDHFRGFEAFWQVPAGEKTAKNGQWVEGPGSKLFAAVRNALGDLPIVAENLGVITPEVEGIRNEFGFPGMSILQFAFGNDPQGPSFRPHNYPRELVAYTGTHDNDTTVGWWSSVPEGDSTRTAQDIDKERAFTRAYLACDCDEINWCFIQTLLASVANTAIVPLQDVLGLGNEARMNLPGSTKRNWLWRFKEGDLTPAMSDRLKQLTAIYDR